MGAVGSTSHSRSAVFRGSRTMGWFAHTYPKPQPNGTSETAVIAWNAAMHAARGVIQDATQALIPKNEFTKAAMIRDLGEVVS